MIQAPDPRQLDRLELAAVTYLLAPMGVFWWGWWRWPVALLMTGLLAVMACFVLQRQRPTSGEPLTWRHWGVIVSLALIWVGSSGLLGALPLNADWNVRMHVLRDLTVGAWPVGYGAAAGGETILRFSLGYYLLPALAGDVGLARILMGAWTVLGVTLLFALVLQNWPYRRPVAITSLLGILVLFSGMDILGFIAGRAYIPEAGEHIEWWGPWIQFSSQTTLLFWVPNHALPAWLGAALIWRHREYGLASVPAALFLAASALWSPLACVGLTPLLLAATARNRRFATWCHEMLHPAVLSAAPVLWLLAIFVSFGVPSMTLTPTERDFATLGFTVATWSSWLLFHLLEWGFFAAVLLSAGCRQQGWVFWSAAGLLLFLSLWRFGPGNDLVMRGAIAPMTLFLLCVAQAWGSGRLRGPWRAALALSLAVGVMTPAQEFIRQSQPGFYWPDDGRTVSQAVGQPWHYIGILRPGWLSSALRTPVPLK